MKSISSIITDREIEILYWKEILYYFEDKEISRIMVFPPRNTRDLHFVYVSDTALSTGNDFILVFCMGVKDLPNNRVCAGLLSLEEYQLYKQDKIAYSYKYLECVEITREDVPEIYKILG